MRCGFGVDVFGTNIKLACFTETGDMIVKWKIPMPSRSEGSEILPLIAEEIEDYIRKNRIMEDDVIGIGVGIPGPVNSAGLVNKCVNLGWGMFNIDKALGGMTGFPVKSGNIANLSAMGECWKGSGSKNMVFIALNTGLGGAVVCDGHVVHGSAGGGGELGHMLVNKLETETCTCGKRGCAEQYCSPTGILRLARRHLASKKGLSILRKSTLTDHREVLNAAASGDRMAIEIMDQVYNYAGQLLANVCCVTNPDTVVMGGDFCEIGQASIDGISRYFHKYVFHASASVNFRMATLDRDACVYGAFKLVLDNFG